MAELIVPLAVDALVITGAPLPLRTVKFVALAAVPLEVK
jgi:hypothetical protein